MIAVLLACSCGLGQSTPGPQYSVVASLLAVRSKPTFACQFILTSLPPAGCAGVEVRNAQVASVPGTTVYRNGTMQTHVVRLVGSWDGRALTLSQSAQVTTEAETTALPVAQSPPAELRRGSTSEVDQRVAHDAAVLQDLGIHLLEVGTGADGVDVVLAVADARSVHTMYDRYGAVHISGWLQPA